jgi:hypothetical protein
MPSYQSTLQEKPWYLSKQYYSIETRRIIDCKFSPLKTIIFLIPVLLFLQYLIYSRILIFLLPMGYIFGSILTGVVIAFLIYSSSQLKKFLFILYDEDKREIFWALGLIGISMFLGSLLVLLFVRDILTWIFMIFPYMGYYFFNVGYFQILLNGSSNGSNRKLRIIPVSLSIIIVVLYPLIFFRIYDPFDNVRLDTYPSIYYVALLFYYPFLIFTILFFSAILHTVLTTSNKKYLKLISQYEIRNEKGSKQDLSKDLSDTGQKRINRIFKWSAIITFILVSFPFGIILIAAIGGGFGISLALSLMCYGVVVPIPIIIIWIIYIIIKIRIRKRSSQNK